jgi:hypothetical protein
MNNQVSGVRLNDTALRWQEEIFTKRKAEEFLNFLILENKDRSVGDWIMLPK